MTVAGWLKVSYDPVQRHLAIEKLVTRLALIEAGFEHVSTDLMELNILGNVNDDEKVPPHEKKHV